MESVEAGSKMWTGKFLKDALTPTIIVTCFWYRRSRLSGTHFDENPQRVSKVKPSTAFLGRLGRLRSHPGSGKSTKSKLMSVSMRLIVARM